MFWEFESSGIKIIATCQSAPVYGKPHGLMDASETCKLTSALISHGMFPRLPCEPFLHFH